MTQIFTDPCPAMPVDIGRPTSPKAIEATSMPVDLSTNTPAMPVVMPSALTPMMLIELCWPPVEVDVVTYDGEPLVDENGEVIYVLFPTR